MNYTTNKNDVIFELPLSDYLGKRYFRQYDPETKQRGERQEKWIDTLQEYEEDFFDNFGSFGSYLTEKEVFKYIEKQDAIDYLKTLPEKYTDQEIAEFDDVLISDILRAVSDAKDGSYQNEWTKKFFRMTQEQIDKDLTENLSGLTFKLLDRIDDKDYFMERADADHLRLVISKKDIKAWLKENYPADGYEKLSDYIDYFHDYALDYSRKPIDTEYIDHYGTMGDWDEWLSYFKDYNEIAGTIDEYRKTEAAKIDNQEAASLNLKPEIEKIDQYIEKYITKEPVKSKITRQIKALKSVIKNS